MRVRKYLERPLLLIPPKNHKIIKHVHLVQPTPDPERYYKETPTRAISFDRFFILTSLFVHVSIHITDIVQFYKIS